MIRRNKIQKKLFMPMGLISLSVISFFGFTKIASVIKQKNAPQYCMQVSFPSLDFANSEHLSTKRKYQNYNLGTNSLSNAITLQLARQTLNNIKSRHDTVNGVRIVIDDSTNYADFITALDNCDEKFPGAFAPCQNQIWAMYLTIDTTDIPKDVLAKWRKKYGRL